MTSSRSVLITGCSSGIGRATADALRARGYRVFATARQERDVAVLRASGFESVRLDLSSSDSIANALDDVLGMSGGKLGGLVNNGAYGQPGAVEDLSRDALRAQFEVNVFGTQELTNRVLPVMRAQRQGRIVQISSLLGFVSLAYRGAYNASKYALEALTDTMRLELRGSGIQLSLIEPGPITSRFRENAYAMFVANIDRTRSAHAEYYRSVEARLGGTKPLPFTLPASAVAACVIKAVESPRPRVRYRITVPAHFLASTKRLLSDRLMDRLLLKITGGGSR
jgi:NAD(P)-dependent dehydrogenase (short-subunit alcohol dehydrogenase family)